MCLCGGGERLLRRRPSLTWPRLSSFSLIFLFLRLLWCQDAFCKEKRVRDCALLPCSLRQGTSYSHHLSPGTQWRKDTRAFLGQPLALPPTCFLARHCFNSHRPARLFSCPSQDDTLWLLFFQPLMGLTYLKVTLTHSIKYWNTSIASSQHSDSSLAAHE